MARLLADEYRAKYSADEVEALGKKGQAVRNDDGTYSYPVADEADLRDAIRAIGRGSSDHNDIRAFVIARAKALAVSDLIPDNWNSDGSLAESNGAWSSSEERETYQDMYTALCDAVADLIGDLDGCYYGWVQDFDDENVYFQGGSLLYSAPYSVEDGGPVTLGQPARVRPVTSYVPADSERSATETPEAVTNERSEAATRLAARTVEYRAARVPKAGDVERRNVTLGRCEIREADDGSGTLLFTGYASVTSTAYDVGFYQETIERGAFRRALANPTLDVQLLVNHTGLPLARTISGTLRLSEDARGLFVEADLDPADEDVKRVATKIARGDVTEMSFAFRAVEQDWSEDYARRSIKQVEIQRGDVSIVSYGASPTTSLAVRSEEALREIRAIGGPALVDALRDYALDWATRSLDAQGVDEFVAMLTARAGKSISASNMETLTRVLNLIATADDAVDEAQPLLADLMGVENPDSDETSEGERTAEPAEEERTDPPADAAEERAHDATEAAAPPAPSVVSPDYELILRLQREAAETRRRAA